MLNLIWKIFIFLFIAGLFMPSEPSIWDDLWLYILCIIISIPILVVINTIKSSKKNDKYENYNSEKDKK